MKTSINEFKESIRLQILICTIGAEGINRVAKARHPEVEGVEYLINWQLPDGDCDIPDDIKSRKDFRVIKWSDRGISVNRNHALENATAPLLLMSDDDILYTVERIESLIREWNCRPYLDIMTFRFDSYETEKKYPETEFDLSRPVKGYFVTAFELSLRLDAVRKFGLRFNSHFGFATTFHGGEEVVFLYDAVRKGARGRFIPVTICTHPGSTTGQRDRYTPEFIVSKGAVVRHIHPFTWPLRMLVHALRESGGDSPISRRRYILFWLKGVVRSHRHGVFSHHNGFL